MTKWVLSSCRAWVSALLSRGRVFQVTAPVHGQFPVLNHRPRNFAGSVTLCSQSAIPRYGSDSCSWQGHDRLARWQRSSTLGCSTVAATRGARPSLAPSRPSVDPYPRLMSSSARVRAVDRPGPPNRPGLEPMSDIPVDVFPEPNRREVGCGYETRVSTFLRAASLPVFGDTKSEHSALVFSMSELLRGQPRQNGVLPQADSGIAEGSRGCSSTGSPRLVSGFRSLSSSVRCVPCWWFSWRGAGPCGHGRFRYWRPCCSWPCTPRRTLVGWPPARS